MVWLILRNRGCDEYANFRYATPLFQRRSSVIGTLPLQKKKQP